MKDQEYLDKITGPGRYYFRTMNDAMKPPTVIGNVVMVNDFGNYRFAENTDENDNVTRWIKELPDGKWTQVVGEPTK